MALPDGSPILNLPEKQYRLWIARNWPDVTSQQVALPVNQFTDNSPSAGYVAWSGVQLNYQGQIYEITDGNSNKVWIYWELATPTVFASSDTYPTIGADTIVIGKNTTGTFRNYYKAGQGIEANMVVGTLTATQINVTELSAISANLGTVTAGTVNGVDIVASTVKTCVLYDADDNVVMNTNTHGSSDLNINAINAQGDITCQGNTHTYTGEVDLELTAQTVDVSNCYQVNDVQVVGAQQAAIANATDAASTMARLNDLLAACRTHGLIDT